MANKENALIVKHKDKNTVLQLDGDYEVVGFIPTIETRICVILSRKEVTEDD